MRVSAEVDERTLREIYLPAFERVVTERAAVDGDVLLQPGQRHVRLAAPVAAHHGAARRVGLRRAGRLRLGRRARPGRRARRPGSTWRCRRSSAAATGALVAAVRAGDARRGGPRRRGRAGCSRLVDRALHRRSSRTTVRRRRPPRAGPGGGRASAAVLLKNDGGCCRSARARPDGRRHRRVRPHAALPGRRQLAGQPDPASTYPLDELRAGVPDGVERSPPASRSDGRRGRRALRAEAVALAAAADVVVVFLGLPGGRRVRGLRPHPHGPARQPGRAAARGRRGQRPASWSCSPTAPRCVTSPWQDARRRDPRGLAARPGGRRRGRRRAVRRRSTPCGRLAETIPLRLEDTPSYLNFPGDSGHVRYGEGVFVGYRGYDRLDAARSASRSATGCPTRPSRYADLAVACPGATRTATSR